MSAASLRADLIRHIIPGVSELLGVPRYAIWVYLSEQPARAMAEFGYILPEQGEEDAWRAALPDEDRRRLEDLERSPKRLGSDSCCRSSRYGS